MSIVKLLKYIAGMMSLKTHLKNVLGFSGVLDLGFFLLLRSDLMFRKGQDIP